MDARHRSIVCVGDPDRAVPDRDGDRPSAHGHVARTVCRRCERIVLRLAREEEVPDEVLRYLNRLSDFLFVLARHLARVFGEDEPLWETPLRK